MKIIMSVERKERGEQENLLRTLKFEGDLLKRGFRFEKALGCWRGEMKNSFVIEANEEREIEICLLEARRAEQKEVLFVLCERFAYMMNVRSRKTEWIGMWIDEEEEEKAEKKGDWTKILRTGKAFSIKEIER